MYDVETMKHLRAVDDILPELYRGTSDFAVELVAVQADWLALFKVELHRVFINDDVKRNGGLHFRADLIHGAEFADCHFVDDLFELLGSLVGVLDKLDDKLIVVDGFNSHLSERPTSHLHSRRRPLL